MLKPISACSILPPAPTPRKASVKVGTMLHTVVPVRRERYLTRFAANMAYRVEFAARAARDLEILYLEKNAAESRMAARWYNGLEEAVFPLETRPQRCPVAPEARAAKRTLRHLL